MTALFLAILNMSITASILILLILLLRIPMKHGPRWVCVLLWGIAAVRLCCPFSVESVMSLLPRTQWVDTAIPINYNEENIAFDEALPTELSPTYLSAVSPATPMAKSEKDSSPAEFFAILWAVGCAAMLVYTVVSYLRLKRLVHTAVRLHGNIYQSEHISSPFVLGIIKPTIYLPLHGVNQRDIPHIIAHETAHIRRGDHLWKPFGFLLLAVHWFNPLVWVAYLLLCRDIETACDEKVIKTLGNGARAGYSAALLNCSLSRRTIAACPLAFGEVKVKERVKTVLQYKKPAMIAVAAAVVVCIVAAVCLLTDPVTKVDDGLMAFAESQVIEHHRSSYSEDFGCFADIEIMGTKKKGDTTLLYTWVLYQEYGFDGGLTKGSASHIPTVLTFVSTSDGSGYTLTDYQIPRDGSYYGDDIRKMFPWYLWGKALDSQWCLDEQQERIMEKAEVYFGTVSEVGGADDPTAVSADPLSKPHKVSTWLWMNPFLSSVVPSEPGLQILVLNETTLYIKHNPLTDAESEAWNTSGSYLREIPLDEETFDSLFFGKTNAGWNTEETTAADVREHNEKAWLSTSVGGQAYLILMQNDGTVLLGLGHCTETTETDPRMRCLYRMTEAEVIPVDPKFDGIKAYYGTTTADIDGDGTEETLALGMGHTSGLFTFTLTAYQDGVPEYDRVFCTKFYNLSFVEENGVVKVQGITQDNPPETHLFDIVVRDGVLDLTENGRSITDSSTGASDEINTTADDAPPTDLVTFTAIIRQWNTTTQEGFTGVLHLDMVDYVTGEDTERVEALGLTEADMPSGYYIHNPEEKETLLTIPEGTTFVFFDWGEDFTDDPRCEVENRWVRTTDIDVFIAYLDTYDQPLSEKEEDCYPKMPFTFTVEDGVMRITEIFLM